MTSHRIDFLRNVVWHSQLRRLSGYSESPGKSDVSPLGGAGSVQNWVLAFEALHDFSGCDNVKFIVISDADDVVEFDMVIDFNLTFCLGSDEERNLAIQFNDLGVIGSLLGSGRADRSGLDGDLVSDHDGLLPLIGVKVQIYPQQ